MNEETIHSLKQKAGSVLFWDTDGSHSAVIDKDGYISGYNQGMMYPPESPNRINHLGYKFIEPQVLLTVIMTSRHCNGWSLAPSGL